MANPNWYYRRVFSFTDLALVHNVRNLADPAVLSPAVPAADRALLPDASQSPYRGISGGSVLDTLLEFQDVFGNRMGDQVPDLALTVGYYDDIVGPAAWPCLDM